MGTFTFKWPHAAEEVYVTGTFDNWEKSEQLEKVGDVFEKTVTLPETSKKIYYKFVVDGKWTTDHAAPQEKDHEGNDNNVLLPENIVKMEDTNLATVVINTLGGPDATTTQLAGEVPREKKDETSPAAAVINTVGPDSTTAQLAGEVPLEKEEANPDAAIINSVGPDSTTPQLAGEVPLVGKKEENKEGIVDGPGTYPETPAGDLDKQVKIDPIPATDITDPPVKLAPGEKIPEGVITGSINDHVTLDKESYEKSDRLPGLETDAPLFKLPPITNDLIPESSLPVVAGGDAVINIVGPDATTAKLAGEVPLEPKVPEIVKESQKEANVEPEASAISEEVKEKAAVEEELLSKVPEAPATSENATTVTEAVVAAGAAFGAVAIGAAIAARDSVMDVAASAADRFPDAAAAAQEAVIDAKTDLVDNKFPVAVDAAVAAKDRVFDAAVAAKDTAASATVAATDTVTDAATDLVDNKVPAAVDATVAAKDNAVEAGGEAVENLPGSVKAFLPITTEQPAVSSEVPATVKESIEEAGHNPEAAANATAVEDKKEVEAELLKEVKPTEAAAEYVAPEVPIVVKESITEAGVSPEAAVSTAAVGEKQEVEAQLLKEVKPTEAAAESLALGVPAAVRESITEAGASPEAAVSAAAVGEKKEVEAQLLKEVKPVESNPTPEASALEETKPAAPTPEASQPVESKPLAVAAQPETNGTKTAAPETKVAAPAQSTAKPTDGASAVEKKKKNRLSAIFSKIKHKLEGKDKP